jgi:hypothetical protein
LAIRSYNRDREIQSGIRVHAWAVVLWFNDHATAIDEVGVILMLTVARGNILKNVSDRTIIGTLRLGCQHKLEVCWKP